MSSSSYHSASHWKAGKNITHSALYWGTHESLCRNYHTGFTTWTSCSNLIPPLISFLYSVPHTCFLCFCSKVFNAPPYKEPAWKTSLHSFIERCYWASSPSPCSLHQPQSFIICLTIIFSYPPTLSHYTSQSERIYDSWKQSLYPLGVNRQTYCNLAGLFNMWAVMFDQVVRSSWYHIK